MSRRRSEGRRTTWSDIDFLSLVWGKQGRGVGCLAYKPDDLSWEEERIHIDSGLDVPRLELIGIDNWGTYFCPNLFMRRRQRDQTLPSRWLYQDLDEVRPDECSITPTLWWETSPGRYQALWLLTHALIASELAPLNKALNRSCGADPGTWNLTRMLRVPGTNNGKRECKVSPAYLFAAHNPNDAISLAA